MLDLLTVLAKHKKLLLIGLPARQYDSKRCSAAEAKIALQAHARQRELPPLCSLRYVTK